VPVWGLDATGVPGPERVGSIPRDELSPAVLTELAELLRVYGDRWVPIGPCLDGGWYAAPRQTGVASASTSLADLCCNLDAREHGG
jgi:hypothetical protein